ncbi:MAG: immunity 22 family protein [Corynebacterium sp.]|uniref:immunity 22 family protein n=1 Tax=Corynebacterium sp. TaxID=1720 RepID=UPI0026DC627D|nr:immunity 22 family protein [Corynebacterium sp.]MDO5099570.1 immunity 22 family protein [Corynebacterium sp.]
MSARTDTVSIWVGDFASEAELEKYLAIDYSEIHDDDDFLASAFTQDFEIEYYDEDCREAYRAETDGLSWQQLIEPLSYAECFADQIPDTIDEKTCVIAVYNLKFDGHVTHKHGVVFVGCYEYHR